MNSIELLQTYVLRNHPTATAELTRPLRRDGMWSLDVDLGDSHLAIQWSASTGFGLATASDENFGEGPDETYDSLEEAQRRIDQLLTSLEQTSPPFGVLLSRLRERRGITQQALADRLGIRQSTLSGIERRQDVQISTVRRVVEALGGVLELFATFKGERYRINIATATGRHRAVSAPHAAMRECRADVSIDENTFEQLRETGRLEKAHEIAESISGRGAVLEMP